MQNQTYRYYLLGESVPVKVTFNDRGLKMGAEAPDLETGQLVIKNTLMSRLEESPEVREIDEEEFLRRCKEFPLKKNSYSGPVFMH